jgi:hypothetical protein
MMPAAATLVGSGTETPWNQLLVYGLVAAVAASLFRWWRKRRDASGFKAIGERYGGTYAPKAMVRAERFPAEDWSAPRTGRPGIEDHLTGSHQGHRFSCFGWVYAARGAGGDGEGDLARVARSVYVMELPGNVGHFSVRKHSAARRMFRKRDVQVGHPEFDEHFTVRSEEPSVAGEVLRGELLEFLLSDPRSKDYPLWFLEDRLICSYPSRFDPDDAEPVLDYLAQVIGHLDCAAPRAAGQRALDEDVVSFGERGDGLSDKKFTLVMGDKEYPRRVALPVVGGLALLVGGGIFGIMRLVDTMNQEDVLTREEQVRLKNIADEHGWTYSYSESGVVDELEGADPFPDASSGLVVDHYTHGRYRGRDIRYFEYADETTMTNNNGRSRTDYYAVFVVSTPDTVPRTLIREEGFLDSVFGGGEVVKTGDSAFDTEFSVITQDREAAEKLVTPRLIDHLSREPDARELPLRFENGEVLTWSEERLRPQQVMARLNYLTEVVNHLPTSGRTRAGVSP